MSPRSRRVVHQPDSIQTSDTMPPMPAAPAAQLDKLRTWRGPRSRTASLSDLVAGMQKDYAQRARRLGGFAQAWDACAPESWRTACRVDAFRGGVARVVVASSAIGFQVDRALRSGLLESLRAACSSAVTRVDVRVGRVHD